MSSRLPSRDTRPRRTGESKRLASELDVALVDSVSAKEKSHGGVALRQEPRRLRERGVSLHRMETARRADENRVVRDP